MIDGIGPMIKGLVSALAFLSLVALYIDRMSTVSNNLEDISDSMEKVHEDIQAVDLKKMETTSNKIETFVDAQLHSRFQQNQQQQPATQNYSGGQNSVEYQLPSSGIPVTISYVGSPDWHIGLKSHSNVEGNETMFEIKFQEEVNTQGVVGKLTNDPGLTAKERKLFGDDPTRLSAHSPYLITSSVPSEDMDDASIWANIILDKMDEKICEIRNLNETFDKEVEKRLS